LSNDKEALRREFLSRREAMGAREAMVKSAVICRRVAALPAFARARSLMAYVAVRNEVNSGALIRLALDGGKRVALPATVPEKKLMVPRQVLEYPGALKTGAYGIPEPDPGSAVLPPEELECLIVPGVAFDREGYRLGFGQGYYDRFMTRLARGAVTIGLGYEWQVCGSVYPSSHDWPLDYVVTEEKVRRFAPQR